MPVIKKCVICGEEFKVRPCQIDAIKACSDKDCKSKLRSITSRNQLLKFGSPSQIPEVAEKIRQKTLKAFKDGKMDHMKKVWKESGKRWAGEGNPRWKGVGSRRNSHGYVLIKCKDNIWRKEERIIAEKVIGRKLRRNELVHHINGIKDDNRKSNLYLTKQSEHRSIHALQMHGNLKIKIISNLT